jgi:hypothetical protein
MSVTPPAPSGTMIRTGLLGQADWARGAAVDPANAANAAADPAGSVAKG